MKGHLAVILVIAVAGATAQDRRVSSTKTRPAISRSASAPGPTALMESARNRSEKGDYAAAMTKLRSALEMAPNSTELLYSYAVTAMRIGKPAEGVRAMSAATRLEPDNPEYLYLLGVAQLWIGATESSTVPLARAAELSPDSVRTQLAYAAALHAVKKYDEATVPLQRALALDPGNSEALYLFADVEQIRGNLTGSNSLLDSLLSRNPRHAGGNLIRGIVLAQQGDLRRARKALELSAEADPDNPRVFAQLSRVCARLGDDIHAAQAQRSFEAATRRSNQLRRQLLQFLESAGTGQSSRNLKTPR